MSRAIPQSKWFWLGLGLVLGAVGGGFLPHAPLHAVATDRQDNFAIATGHVDDELEAVFFLDFLTGDLKAAVINPVRGVIGLTYNRNVLADLQVDPAKNPKFMMVTGDMQVRGPGGPGLYAVNVVYVAEASSGMMAVYAMPFNRGVLNNSTGSAQSVEFQKIFAGPFRQAVVR
jgi:hypothetical protein